MENTFSISVERDGQILHVGDVTAFDHEAAEDVAYWMFGPDECSGKGDAVVIYPGEEVIVSEREPSWNVAVRRDGELITLGQVSAVDHEAASEAAHWLFGRGQDREAETAGSHVLYPRESFIITPTAD